MAPAPTLSAQHRELLENASWLQRLALGLVRDPQLADDMVQQTMIAALENAPAQSARQRPWLARVLRNKVNAGYRSDSRRQKREARVAVPECGEVPNDVVERAEIGQLLTAAVMRLDEPYRSTLLMRFHEDKTPSEIAKELGIPATTVRTRLGRGLDQLRREISHSWGKDWQTCSPALVAFARAGGAGATKSGLLLIGAALAIGISTTLFVLQDWGSKRPAVAPIVSTPAGDEVMEQPDVASSRSARPDLEITRETLDSKSATVTPIAEGTVILKGRCIAEESGKPLAGCRIEIQGFLPDRALHTIHAQDNGEFEIQLENPALENDFGLSLFIEGRLYRRAVWRAKANPLQSHDFGDILFKKGTVFQGRILTEAGTPVANAPINFGTLERGALLASSAKLDVHTSTDEMGVFQLDSALPPGVRDFQIHAKGFMQVGKNLSTFVTTSRFRSLNFE